MDIQKYMAFIKTVECGSFTHAAEALSYSQSGISRTIGDLEREWKGCLLERGHTGVWLPVHADLETMFLAQDRLLAILPEGHRLAGWPDVSGFRWRHCARIRLCYWKRGQKRKSPQFLNGVA